MLVRDPVHGMQGVLESKGFGSVLRKFRQAMRPGEALDPKWPRTGLLRIACLSPV